ncbi:hypothetical protein ABH926_009406 [Catenulispora sp. GP43]|uniref:hypothetical protein n=1 Tax=Catenulispora sp. GP43 TaxID=3156263 RepID=UPI0035160000
MPRKQIWSGAVLAAVAASSLTGCSLKGSDGTPQSFAQLSSLSAGQAIQAADFAVASHPTAKVHTVLTSATASETSDVVASFDDHPSLQGTLVMSQTDPSDPSAQAAGPAIPIRYADDVMYMQMGGVPQMAAQMDGKQWLKMDLQAMAQDPNTASFGTDVLENTSPSKGLTMLAASKDLHAVGAEQRGGVQTMHYAGTLAGDDVTDPNVAGRNGLTADDAATVSDALAQGLVTKLGYDVWLGANGLPVAMTFTETTPNGSMTGEIDYSAWGTSVAVAPIPDTQSADFVAMVKQAEAAQSGSQDSGSGSSTPTSPASSEGSAAPSSPSSPTSPAAPSTPSTPGTPSSPAAPSVPSTPGAPTPTGPASTSSTSSSGTSSSSSSSSASSSASSAPSGTSSSGA